MHATPMFLCAAALGMCFCGSCTDDDAGRVNSGAAATSKRGHGHNQKDGSATDASGTDRAAGNAHPPDPNEWLVFGGDLNQLNARTDSGAFGREKLSNLRRAWSIDAPGVSGTPVVHAGTVYWADWMGGVYAVAADSGEQKWQVKFDRGFTSSPTIANGRLFFGDRDGRVYALDAESGETIWQKRIDEHSLAQVWSSLVVAQGVLLVGIGGKSTNYSDEELMTFRGSLNALDVASGETLWRFETTHGSDGEEFGAGVAVWSTPAVDVKRGVLFVGTGNSYFSPASPFSDSLIALKVKTGEVVWTRQFTTDDNFTRANPVGPDSDVGATPNLFELDGRDVVGVGDKAGHYYLMKRDDGELLWSRMLSPGSSLGGVIANAAVADGRIYVASNENFMFTQLHALNAADGEVVWKVQLQGPTYGGLLRLGSVLFAGTAGNYSGTVAGPLLALDPDTGAQLWAADLDHSRAGGLAAAGDSIFVPTGFHLFMDNLEPIGGSLTAFRLGAIAGEDEMASDAGMSLPPSYEPTFPAIYTEIFQTKGCTEKFCHGKEGMLSMNSAGEAYEQLVEIDATGDLCASTKLQRVKPGAPDDSLLFKKLKQDPPCGARMPVGGMLDDKQMDQIKVWIEAGAKPD
jgi:polyvinyl alcohol dehydrogenase (cytochrome)